MENFKHQSFALFNAEGKDNWIKLRNIFRAMKVRQASLEHRISLNEREAAEVS